MTVLERSTATGFNPKRLGKILGSAALVGAIAVGSVFAINNVAVEETSAVASSTEAVTAHPRRTPQRNTFSQNVAPGAVGAALAGATVNLAARIEGYPSTNEPAGSASEPTQSTYGGLTAK